MNDETKKQSVFMQMHNGIRTSEGSFNIGLQKLFYLAGPSNRRKLVEAFPEFFGDEVPEFGITKHTSTDDKDIKKIITDCFSNALQGSQSHTV